MQNDAVQRVQDLICKTVEAYGMLAPGDSVLVGISGGADSVCLLHALWNLRKLLKIQLSAAHVEHGIRGGEAERDAEFVRRLCQDWGVPLFLERVDVPALAAEQGLSLETAGRLARYRAFHRICREQKLDKIATAHNQNDQAETVLMRMLRGTGLDGLAGIRYIRKDGVIRPLLDVPRALIEAYLAQCGLDYCRDSTNGEDSYTRNRIRNQTLPALCREFNPNLVETLAGMARGMAQDADFIAGYAGRLYRRINTPAPAQKPVVLDMESLKMVDACIQVRLIRLAAQDAMGERYRLERRHIQAVLALLDRETGAAVELPEGLRAAVRYGWIAMETPEEQRQAQARQKAAGSLQYDVELGRVLDMEAYQVTFALASPKQKLLPNQMMLDYDRLADLPLEVRTRRRGDRIAVYRDGRSKKLKDYLIDLKVPRARRGSIPLLCIKGGEVAAVIGYRVAEPYRIQKDSERGLVITYDETDEDW